MKYKLPTSFSEKDKSPLIHYSSVTHRVTYTGTGKSDTDAGSIRTLTSIPVQCGVFYYETEITSKGRDGYIAIGFCGRGVSMNR